MDEFDRLVSGLMEPQPQQPMVQVKPGMWLRAGTLLRITNPEDGLPMKCPVCGSAEWTVQTDGRLRSEGCGMTGRAK